MHLLGNVFPFLSLLHCLNFHATCICEWCPLVWDFSNNVCWQIHPLHDIIYICYLVKAMIIIIINHFFLIMLWLIYDLIQVWILLQNVCEYYYFYLIYLSIFASSILDGYIKSFFWTTFVLHWFKIGMISIKFHSLFHFVYREFFKICFLISNFFLFLFDYLFFSNLYMRFWWYKERTLYKSLKPYIWPVF